MFIKRWPCCYGNRLKSYLRLAAQLISLLFSVQCVLILRLTISLVVLAYAILRSSGAVSPNAVAVTSMPVDTTTSRSWRTAAADGEFDAANDDSENDGGAAVGEKFHARAPPLLPPPPPFFAQRCDDGCGRRRRAANDGGDDDGSTKGKRFEFSRDARTHSAHNIAFLRATKIVWRRSNGNKSSLVRYRL